MLAARRPAPVAVLGLRHLSVRIFLGQSFQPLTYAAQAAVRLNFARKDGGTGAKAWSTYEKSTAAIGHQQPDFE
jgi:hypothetical protein